MRELKKDNEATLQDTGVLLSQPKTPNRMKTYFLENKVQIIPNGRDRINFYYFKTLIEQFIGDQVTDVCLECKKESGFHKNIQVNLHSQKFDILFKTEDAGIGELRRLDSSKGTIFYLCYKKVLICRFSEHEYLVFSAFYKSDFEYQLNLYQELEKIHFNFSIGNNAALHPKILSLLRFRLHQYIKSGKYLVDRSGIYPELKNTVNYN